MKRLLVFLFILTWLSACDLYKQEDLITSQEIPLTGFQTYTVLVGGEAPDTGAELEAYFPAELHIHQGDTVVWQQNAAEVHTVTFSSGEALPDLIVPAPYGAKSPFMFNQEVAFPVRPKSGIFDGSSYANSGLLGRDQGEAPAFRLTFPTEGVYVYHCAVHGSRHQDGVIVVEDPSKEISSPEQVEQQAKLDIQNMLATVPQVVQDAEASLIPDEQNPDGTTTHHILAGFSEGAIDLRAFFPSSVTARPGDTIDWTTNQDNQTPHTITFLNGAEPPPVVLLDLQPGSHPLLLVNPGVAIPMNTDQALLTIGIVNSGLIYSASSEQPAFSIRIGNFNARLTYLCLFHSGSGMEGTLEVIPN